MHNPESVIENEANKPHWDFVINRITEFLPDDQTTRLYDNQKATWRIVDFAVSQSKIERKIKIKIKYLELPWELKKNCATRK